VAGLGDPGQPRGSRQSRCTRRSAPSGQATRPNKPTSRCPWAFDVVRWLCRSVRQGNVALPIRPGAPGGVPSGVWSRGSHGGSAIAQSRRWPLVQPGANSDRCRVRRCARRLGLGAHGVRARQCTDIGRCMLSWRRREWGVALGVIVAVRVSAPVRFLGPDGMECSDPHPHRISDRPHHPSRP
jgi:hypothetical protein